MFKLWGSRDTQPDAPPSPGEPDASASGMGGFEKLKSAVSLTGKALVESIVSLGKTDATPLSDEDIENIEETLIRADVGVDFAVEIAGKIRSNKSLHTPDKLKAFLKEEFTRVLSLGTNANTLKFIPGHLNIYLFVGVNGAGKTTMIGKLANRFVEQGQQVVIAAGDTFRAAAEDQLEIWAQRAGAQLVRKDKADTTAVIFDALQVAKSQPTDVLIIDTAGRLQNKFNLMEELRKVKKVIEREAPPDHIYEALLVIDATTGQNAMRQAEVFKEAADLTGVALTKLDGSAKGGIVFNVAREYQLPVKLVGVGEKIGDIREFVPADFIDALFEK